MFSSKAILLSFAFRTSAYTVIGATSFMLKNIDPIVFPQQYCSHMHTFFGSDALTVNTTTSDELRAGCTTANNPNDLSTYWQPTLYYTGGAQRVPVYPERFSVYYENIEDAEIALPDNLKMLAGKSHATSQNETDPNAKVTWFCENEPTEDKDAAAWPTETCPTHLQNLVYFPDCVDPDNVGNYTYNAHGHCPSNMKRIPRIRYSVRYDLRGVIKDGWSGQPPLALSSGGGSPYSIHGDVVMGWTQEAKEFMLTAVGSTFLPISPPTGSLGNPYNGANCKAKDADPSHGTSNYTLAASLTSSCVAAPGY